MDRVSALQVFISIVQTESFTKAADRLQMPRSTVSAAIQQLEARLGTRLLHRTTRHVRLTLDGSAYYERCLRLLADFEEADSLFRQNAVQPRGKLRISVPSRLGRLILVPALPAFFSRYPAIELELVVTDRAVDLVHEGIDCVVRVGTLRDSRLVARPVGTMAVINCASPDYLARHGTPKTIDDLSDHLAVGYTSLATGRAEDWDYVDAGRTKRLQLRSQVTVNNAEAYIACCIAGLGLIQIPAYDVREQLGCGELVEVLPASRPAPLPVSLVYSHREHLSRRLQAFIAWGVPLLVSGMVLTPVGSGTVRRHETS